MDPDKTQGIIDTVKNMSSRELAVTVTLIVMVVAAAFWVENRYAKLTETEERIARHQAQLIQVQTQILELINAQSPEAQRQIRERSREFVEHITAITREQHGKELQKNR